MPCDLIQPFPIPREMTLEDIKASVEQFRQAALNSVEAGFDGVEVIHRVRTSAVPMHYFRGVQYINVIQRSPIPLSYATLPVEKQAWRSPFLFLNQGQVWLEDH